VKVTVGLVLLLAACDRHAASAGTTASAAPQRSAAPVKSGITPFPADPTAEPPPLDLGPAADSASSNERQERLVELLRGQTPAETLLLGHTDPGHAFDSDQFRNLTTSVQLGDKSLGRRGGASVGQHRLLSGDLAGQPLERVLSAMRAGFRHCYNRALQVDPKLEGSVVLRVEIDRSGAMSKVSVVSAPPRSVELKRCVVARVQATQLDPLPGPVQFELPVTFAIEGG
jgi:TonB family protein